jgi:hypothetical protein
MGFKPHTNKKPYTPHPYKNTTQNTLGNPEQPKTTPSNTEFPKTTKKYQIDNPIEHHK